jgi:hypothetical protein
MGGRRAVAAGVALLLATLTVQIVAGAYASDRDAWSDEASHFMNGLVIRDYVYDAAGRNPLTYATEYYQHYPKIAPMMWPPLYHVLLGVFLLPGWAPDAAAIFLVGVFAAWTAWRLWTMLSTTQPPIVAAAAPLFFLLTPIVVRVSSAVMLDIVVTAFFIEAVYRLAAYFRTGARRDAVWFGVWTACACLTKGNAVAIPLAPLVLILVTGRFDVLRRSGLYLAAAIVLVFAVPLLIWNARMVHALGDFGPATPDLIGRRIGDYVGYSREQLGIVPSLLALIGWVGALLQGRRVARTVPAATAGLATLIAAFLIFHLLNPHPITNERYFAIIAAPLLGLIPVGAATVAQLVRTPSSRRVMTWSMLAVVGALLASGIPRALTIPGPLGFRDVVANLAASAPLADRQLLVVSDERGEGALIAAVAVRGEAPRPTVLRGSKFLGSDDWMGRGATVTHASAAALAAAVRAANVDTIVVDLSEEARRLPYWPQLAEALPLLDPGIAPVLRTAGAGGRRDIIAFRLK